MNSANSPVEAPAPGHYAAANSTFRPASPASGHGASLQPLRWPILGGVRFLLALVVAATHLGQKMGFSTLTTQLSSFSAIAAVLGFLIISGYSIAASYDKARVGFYRRRLLRIWPLYILAILFGCAVMWDSGASTGFHGMPPTGRIVANLFFLQGWTAYSILSNAVVWTLSVEVFCYLLTPVLARLSPVLVMTIAGFSAMLYCAYPAMVENPRPYHLLLRGQAAALLMWCWLLGFIAYRSRNHAVAAWVIFGKSGGFGSLIDLATVNPADLGHRWAITIGVVILGIACTEKLRGPRWLAAFGTLLGDASYPLYLFHMPLYFVLPRIMRAPLSSAVILGLTVLLAVALDRFYDHPVKRLFTRSRVAA